MIEDQKFYWTLLDTLKDGVYFANKQRKITYWNKAAEAITGYKGNEMLGRFCADNLLIHIDEDGNNLCRGGCPLSRSMETGKICEEKVYLHHKDGQRVPVFVRTSPVYGSGEEIVGAVEVFTDLSDWDVMTTINALGKPDLFSTRTGLPTRPCLEMHIRMKIFEWEEFQHVFGIFYIRVGGLEKIKTGRGREAVDNVLKTLSRTLIHNMSSCYIVGEWGAGEFLGIAAYADEEKLSATADHYRMLLEKTGFSHLPDDDASAAVTISVGTALVQKGDTIEKLIERARKI